MRVATVSGEVLPIESTMRSTPADFIDRVRIRVEAGDGGNGCVSFRREKFVPRGGPDGGAGGGGGSITFKVNPGRNTLEALHSQPVYRAPGGQNGGTNGKTGRCGEDMVLEVPPGTVVYDSDSGELLGDIEQSDGVLVVVRGGKGGRGNASFATSTRQVPYNSEPGTEGEKRSLRVELKTVADVGLVGLPNAGKSTLISKLTAAKPRIANYPFTTLHPILGTISLRDGSSLVIADIPGIIEGASEGLGLGFDFLRHIERTRVLVYVVEVNPADLSAPSLTLSALQEEIRAYDASILERPYLVTINKMDLCDDDEERNLVLEDFATQRPDVETADVFPVSALNADNLQPLRLRLLELCCGVELWQVQLDEIP